MLNPNLKVMSYSELDARVELLRRIINRLDFNILFFSDILVMYIHEFPLIGIDEYMANKIEVKASRLRRMFKIKEVIKKSLMKTYDVRHEVLMRKTDEDLANCH